MTREAIARALEQQDERASVKIMIKDFADGWYELSLDQRPSVGKLLTALELAPQAGGELVEALNKIDKLTQYSNGNPEGQLFAVQQIIREFRGIDATPAQPEESVMECKVPGMSCDNMECSFGCAYEDMYGPLPGSELTWRPIDTVDLKQPVIVSDGTWFGQARPLGGGSGGWMTWCTFFYRHDGKQVDHRPNRIYPTHWMPSLPAPEAV